MLTAILGSPSQSLWLKIQTPSTVHRSGVICPPFSPLDLHAMSPSLSIVTPMLQLCLHFPITHRSFTISRLLPGVLSPSLYWTSFYASLIIKNESLHLISRLGGKAWTRPFLSPHSPLWHCPIMRPFDFAVFSHCCFPSKICYQLFIPWYRFKAMQCLYQKYSCVKTHHWRQNLLKGHQTSMKRQGRHVNALKKPTPGQHIICASAALCF